MTGGQFQKLQVWQKSMELVTGIYACTKTFPSTEIYGITSQMRRCAISIPSNIAEGSQRTSDKDFGHFILIAKGSLAELHTQILIARNLEYLSEDLCKKFIVDIEEIDRMLRSFHAKLKA